MIEILVPIATNKKNRKTFNLSGFLLKIWVELGGKLSNFFVEDLNITEHSSTIIFSSLGLYNAINYSPQ